MIYLFLGPQFSESISALADPQEQFLRVKEGWAETLPSPLEPLQLFDWSLYSYKGGCRRRAKELSHITSLNWTEIKQDPI